ncbi:fungal-specific transcription factor domain-containing protein [Lactarius indigo]|nr:fungal-specific transcription factor domain-containing protein [Lactarius indigo]
MYRRYNTSHLFANAASALFLPVGDCIGIEILRMREPSVSTASPTDSTSQANEPSKPRLKRNRIILSCQPCHKRKQQCDRGHPCSRCVNRGCPDACTYEEPKELKKRKWTETAPVQDESVTVPHLGRPSDPDSTNNSESNTVAGLDVLLQLLQSTNASNVTHIPQSGDLELSRSQANENAVQAAATALNQLSQQEAPDTQNPIAAMLQSVRSPLRPIYFMRNESFQQFRGYATPMQLSELQRHFPNQKITTFLLSYYFDKSSSHWLLPVVHRPYFETYYRTFSSGPLPPPIEFIALLAITCATALQFLPETDEDAVLFADYPSGRQVLERRLVEFSRCVLFTCTEYPLSSLERIQALTLFSIYQWNEANTGECWYIATLAIRMAQTLSLNRDGTSTWRMRPEDAEIRRRLWWILFTIDRCHCMEYRRPYIISEQHTDVAFPMNLDQVDVVDAPDLTGKPVEEPTDSLFHIYQSKFQKLSGHIWDQCFCVTLPTYRVVLDLEEQLRRFELEIPTSLRFQTAQTTVSRPYLALQYQMLVLEITHNRMQLLRPFLFIHPTKDKDFEGLSSQDKKLSVFHKHARAICVTFCKRQLALLQLLQKSADPGHTSWSGMTLLAFKPALTLAIAIIMDTQNPENEEFEEWIAMAQGILIALKPYNALAKKALEYLDVIRKRTLFVLGVVTGRCRQVAGDPAQDAACDVAPPMVLSQRLDRAMRMSSQPQPCLVDHLGREEASDSFWSTLHPGVFAGHFPGIESLSGPVSLQSLEQFLDSCLSMHSRLPHTFTF